MNNFWCYLCLINGIVMVCFLFGLFGMVFGMIYVFDVILIIEMVVWLEVIIVIGIS